MLLLLFKIFMPSRTNNFGELVVARGPTSGEGPRRCRFAGGCAGESGALARTGVGSAAQEAESKDAAGKRGISGRAGAAACGPFTLAAGHCAKGGTMHGTVTLAAWWLAGGSALASCATAHAAALARDAGKDQRGGGGGPGGTPFPERRGAAGGFLVASPLAASLAEFCGPAPLRGERDRPLDNNCFCAAASAGATTDFVSDI
mmetsp:Transcript_139357/g.242567  ORF Transcript_139357/g.242567 Transcript_139357/m.242567 type:complete len:203 (+) Transcript_139357:501-1109(+)